MQRQTAQGGYTGTVGRKETILSRICNAGMGLLSGQRKQDRQSQHTTLVFNQAFNEKIIK